MAAQLIFTDEFGNAFVFDVAAFAKPQLSIGRDAASDICISSAYVSRRHGAIDVLSPGLSYQGFPGTNGILHNGGFLPGGGLPLLLKPGDVLTFGDLRQPGSQSSCATLAYTETSAQPGYAPVPPPPPPAAAYGYDQYAPAAPLAPPAPIPAQDYYAPPQQETYPFVCAIIGLALALLPLSIVALVNANKSIHPQATKIMAWIGLGLQAFTLLMLIFFFLLPLFLLSSYY